MRGGRMRRMVLGMTIAGMLGASIWSGLLGQADCGPHQTVSRHGGISQALLQSEQVAATDLATAYRMAPNLADDAAASRGQAQDAEHTPSVGKWQRFEVALHNPAWDGNPFDLIVHGVFTHLPTGRRVAQLGFYAGDDIWRIYFMPDELGQWDYVTTSDVAALDGQSGSLTAVASELPGRLLPDGNRWRLSDSGEVVSPIILAVNRWFKRTETSQGISDFIRWADEEAGALLIGTTFTFFRLRPEEVPYLKGQEGEWFNIEMWDRINSHYDALRDRGMGFYFMFFTDDDDSPNRFGIRPQSVEEERLLRYAVARFSAYPIVVWDSGIDITEYRSMRWIDWFVTWMLDNDPWQHPVSSRTGGGSGGKFPDCATYYSDGTSTLPSHQRVVANWTSRVVPTAYTDRWREDFWRGGFDREKIRRAAWEVGLVGGPMIYFSGNEGDGSLESNYASDLAAAPDLGHRSRFFRVHIRDFGALHPHSELLTGLSDAVLVANPGMEYVVYSHEGGRFYVDLSAVAGRITAAWFNPRTGIMLPAATIRGGSICTFDTPDHQDWVLHLVRPQSEAMPNGALKGLLPAVTVLGAGDTIC
jgi:hypothetical protein